MNGNLYFNSTAVWVDPTPVGSLRDNKRGYTVRTLTELNRSGNPETIGYEVEVNSLVLTLDSNFLTEDEWYFRVYFLDEQQYIDLGQRKYIIDYDGLIQRNGIEYHEVKLKFNIAVNEYSDYAIPVDI